MADTKMVLGLVQDRASAETVLRDLESAGYNPKDISIMMRDKVAGRAIADTTGATVAEGAVGGAATGGIIGGIAGLLVGIGAIAIPGLGAILIGGPIAAALGLTGAAATTATGAVTGALAGGLIGALVNLGLPEQDARVYNREISQGAILLAIPAFAGTEAKAEEILSKDGADTIRVLTINDTAPSAMPAGAQWQQAPVGAAGGMAYTDPQGNIFQDTSAANSNVWLESLLDNLTYPVAKHDIIRYAVRHDVDDTILQRLDTLPADKEFTNADEVRQNLH